jgi:hypothetical protein
LRYVWVKVKVQLSIAVVKPGRIMFEVGGLVSCKRGVTSCGSKVKTKFVVARDSIIYIIL